MSISKAILATTALGIGTTAMAQDFFDFGQIPGVPDEPAVQIDLNRMLLDLGAQTTRPSNPAAADLLANIDGVRIRIYKPLDTVDDVLEFVDEISNRLQRDDWQQVVSVQEDGQIRVFVQGSDESITGITAMVVHDQAAIFLNIVGDITAEQLAQAIAMSNSGELVASLGDFSLSELGPAND